jgi:hypothetical protein
LSPRPYISVGDNLDDPSSTVDMNQLFRVCNIDVFEFVVSVDGEDANDCGRSDIPCKTIKYVVDNDTNLDSASNIRILSGKYIINNEIDILNIVNIVGDDEKELNVVTGINDSSIYALFKITLGSLFLSYLTIEPVNMSSSYFFFIDLNGKVLNISNCIITSSEHSEIGNYIKLGNSIVYAESGSSGTVGVFSSYINNINVDNFHIFEHNGNLNGRFIMNEFDVRNINGVGVGSFSWSSCNGYISESIFQNINGENGSCFYIPDGILTIVNCYFNSCVALQYGGAIYIHCNENEDSGDFFFLNVSYSSFNSNMGKYGGAIFINASEQVHHVYFMECNFFDNVANTGSDIFDVLASSSTYSQESIFIFCCSNSSRPAFVISEGENLDSLFVEGCDFNILFISPDATESPEGCGTFSIPCATISGFLESFDYSHRLPDQIIILGGLLFEPPFKLYSLNTTVTIHGEDYQTVIFEGIFDYITNSTIIYIENNGNYTIHNLTFYLSLPNVAHTMIYITGESVFLRLEYIFVSVPTSLSKIRLVKIGFLDLNNSASNSGEVKISSCNFFDLNIWACYGFIVSNIDNLFELNGCEFYNIQGDDFMPSIISLTGEVHLVSCLFQFLLKIGQLGEKFIPTITNGIIVKSQRIAMKFILVFQLENIFLKKPHLV